MYCENCGNPMKDGAAFCDKCGAVAGQYADEETNEPVDSKNKKINSKQLIPIIVAAVIVLITVIVLIAVSAGKSGGKNLEKKLDGLTNKDVISFCRDDYNGDGEEEAFAVAGTGSESGFESADIWFVSENAGGKVKENVSGSLNGIIEENGRKYISVEITESGGSRSFIYGVKGKDTYYEPQCSGVFSGVHQQDGVIMTVEGQPITVDASVQGEVSAVQQETTVSETSVSETSKASTTTTEAPKTTSAAADTGWRSAYKDYLYSLYNDSSKETNDVVFSLGYVDDDDIPELFLSWGEWHFAPITVATYHNGTFRSFDEIFSSWGSISYSRKEGILFGGGGNSGIMTTVVYKLSGNSLTELTNVTENLNYFEDVGRVETRYSIGDRIVSKEEYDNEKNKYLSEQKISTASYADRSGLSLTPSNIDKLDTMNAR